MFNEDNLAAAQIAQIFGSELLKVQQNAQTDSGTMPDIVKLNPKQFLMGDTQFRSERKVEEQRMIRALQLEAEAAYPIAHSEQPPYTPQVAPELPPRLISAEQHGSKLPLDRPKACPEDFALDLRVLERIAISLERIANVVDKVDIKTKKKTVKRKPKYNKVVLLNETTS